MKKAGKVLLLVALVLALAVLKGAFYVVQPN